MFEVESIARGNRKRKIQEIIYLWTFWSTSPDRQPWKVGMAKKEEGEWLGGADFGR